MKRDWFVIILGVGALTSALAFGIISLMGLYWRITGSITSPSVAYLIFGTASCAVYGWIFMSELREEFRRK